MVDGEIEAMLGCNLENSIGVWVLRNGLWHAGRPAFLRPCSPLALLAPPQAGLQASVPSGHAADGFPLLVVAYAAASGLGQGWLQYELAMGTHD